MNHRCFTIMCHLLKTIARLTSMEVVDVEEMVAMFLHILAHDPTQYAYHFGDSSDWGAGNAATQEGIHSFSIDRFHKLNFTCTAFIRFIALGIPFLHNVLGVCDTIGDFVYVLTDWEQSTADSRILLDVISRPNSLKVSKGYYYLVDAGYPNAEGFLAPYRGQCYHLQERRGAENAPSTSKEFFNMKYSSAGNVIERAFGVLKGRWAILQGKSYYPVEVQCRTILACCLPHNLINRVMTNFNIEDDIDEVDFTCATTATDGIHYIETSNEWTQWRGNLAQEMFNEWELCNHMASSLRLPKYNWTKEEEAGLIVCLVELVDTGGWRSDNGTFRPEYQISWRE
ncbi:retrotransposon protein [Cucumis melo var. makuwa]|uniref:Retrotransposon protein n=1 Tax=Cucumis melo var. makuwa TaxID=1194695 RepID=A0A5D3D6D5_CUCMM|nr:retrotransposon protein [Cucumis melo var. makuwa]